MIVPSPDTALNHAQLNAHLEGGEPQWKKLDLGES